MNPPLLARFELPHGMTLADVKLVRLNGQPAAHVASPWFPLTTLCGIKHQDTPAIDAMTPCTLCTRKMEKITNANSPNNQLTSP
jgi:hypothetical protein